MTKISVIIPVYNTEKYLEKCLDSIVRQTYKNIEILIVDDGSKDNSYKIYEKYNDKDDRVHIITKINGGLSDARNCGIEKATGEYICFVDSDDYVELNYIEKMYNAIEKEHADICCCGKIVEKGNKKSLINCKTEFVVNSFEALKLYLQKSEIDNSAVDKLYRKELFDKIKFPVGRYFEDIGTVYKLFFVANKIVHINNPLYHYVMRSGSICHEAYSEKQLDMLHMTREASSNISKLYPELNEYATSYYALSVVTTIMQIYRYMGKEELYSKYKYIIDEYVNNYNLYITNRYIPKIKKIMMFFIRYRFYKFVDVIWTVVKK